MSKILNYEKGETLATGFVRPKVTSLFFDKIWIPEEILDSTVEFLAVPREVLVLENEHRKLNDNFYRIIKENFKKAVIDNQPFYSDNFFDLVEKDNFENLFEIAEFRPGELYLFKRFSNMFHPIKLEGFNDVEFKYSKNRNQAILTNAENFNREYKISISPIFHDLTEFEKEIQSFDVNETYREKDINSNFANINFYENKSVFAVCIQDFPSIKEDELSWEQVLDVRKDKKRREQLKRFTTWANKNFANYSPEQIRETLEAELEAYKDALKEHGIKTAVGSFTTLVSSASSIASLISEPNSLLLPLLSITAVSINFTTNTYLSSLKNKKAPIAYLYDISDDGI